MQTYLGLTLAEIDERVRATGDELVYLIDELDAQLPTPVDDLELFLEYIAEGKSMLDIGCGSARYLDWFIAHGLEYTGIDISPCMIKLVRSRHPNIRLEVMSYRSLQFPDESFDALWCCCSLSHEPKSNIGNVFAELRRVLRPSGILALVMPNLGVGRLEEVGRVHQAINIEGYWALWEVKELEDAIKAAQFEIVLAGARQMHGSMTIIGRK